MGEQNNGFREDQCGSCYLFEEAANLSIADGRLYRIESPGEIVADEERLMHAKEFILAGVECNCYGLKKKHVNPDSPRPCENHLKNKSYI